MKRHLSALCAAAVLALTASASALGDAPAIHPSLQTPAQWRYGIDPHGTSADYGEQLVSNGVAHITFNRVPRPNPEENSWIELIYDLPQGDLRGVDRIALTYQSSEPLLVKLSQRDFGEQGDESYAHYQALVPAADEWRQVTLSLGDFARPAWTPSDSVDVGLLPAHIDALYFAPNLDDAVGGFAELKIKAVELLP